MLSLQGWGPPQEAAATKYDTFVRDVPLVVLSAIGWTALHLVTPSLIRSLRPSWLTDIDVKKHDELYLTVMGFVHSLVICYLSIQALLHEVPNADFMKDPTYTYSPYCQLCIIVAAGYFLWDLGACIVYSYGAAFLFHAVTCLSLYLIALHGFVHLAAPCFLLFELSTPFLHIRWLLISLKQTASLAFKIVNPIFGLTFVLVRILIGYPMSVMLVIWPIGNDLWAGAYPDNGVATWQATVMLVGMTLLDVINGYWLYAMVQSQRKRKKT